MRVAHRVLLSSIWPVLVGLLTSAAGRAAPDLLLAPRSPAASVAQTVGITTITVDYNSPAVAGRAIWQAVAPPGVPWRTGEGPVPTIRFGRDVVFAGTAVPAGSYALLTIPSATDWIVILNRDTQLTAMADYRPSHDVARGVAQVEAVPHRERLTFLFPDFSDEEASLALEWGDRRICIPIRVHTTQQIESAIRALDDGWRWYADAAVYLLETKKDYEGGLRFIDQSLRLTENWQNLWIKASLLAAVGNYPEARQQADRAYQLGRKEGSAFTIESKVQAALAAWNRPTLPTLGDPPVPPPRELPEVALPERAVRVHGSNRSTARLSAPRPAEIGPRIKRGRPEIQTCYQRALRQDPTLTRARIAVSVDIGTSGIVKNVVLDPPQASGALDRCLKDTISRWVFPLSPVEYGAEFPVVLRGTD